MVLGSFFCLILWHGASAGSLAAAIELAVKNNDAAAKSQGRVEKSSDDTSDLLAQYRSTEQQIESLSIYNGQLQKLIDAQEAEAESLRTQIDNAATVAREVTPLMLRMIDALETFVNLDVPFLKVERAKRMADLRDLMDRSDVTDSEKYRRLLEAYQIENEYGHTIETYQASVEINGVSRTLDFLRVGRVSLVYQTLDGKEAGVWDNDARNWVELPSSHRTSIMKGLRMARKQAAPDLIRLPIAAPKDAAQ